MARCSGRGGNGEAYPRQMIRPKIELSSSSNHQVNLTLEQRRGQHGIGDEIAIVLHGLGPVIHEVLIDIVGIEERRGLKGGEQVLGDAGDERLGVAVLGEALELRDGGGLPLGEELPGLGGEGGELRVGEDDGLDFSLGWLNGGVAGAGDHPR